MPSQSHQWWKERVVYEVWSASYKDSNDDGIGDIQGVILKLDYLKELGIGIIWISPPFSKVLKMIWLRCFELSGSMA